MKQLAFLLLVAVGVACGESKPMQQDVDPDQQAVLQAAQNSTDEHQHFEGDGHDHSAHEDQPSQPIVDVSGKTYDEILAEAEKQIGANKLQAAIIAFLEAARTDSTRAEGFYGLGYCFKELGNAKKGLFYFDKSMAIDPNYRNTALNRGICLAQLGRFEEGLQETNKAIAANVKCSECLLNRAFIYKGMEDFESMCKDLRKAQELGNGDAAEIIAEYCK